MSNFEIGEKVLLNGKEYKIVGTVKRSFKLERDGKFYKATAKMMGKIQVQNENGIGVGRKTRTRNTIDHIEKRLNWKRMFDKTAKRPETTEECMDWLGMLTNELSPENLFCDGEISRSAAMKKASGIRAEWKQVEKILGYRVSEGDAESHIMKKYYEKRKSA